KEAARLSYRRSRRLHYRLLHRSKNRARDDLSALLQRADTRHRHQPVQGNGRRAHSFQLFAAVRNGDGGLLRRVQREGSKTESTARPRRICDPALTLALTAAAVWRVVRIGGIDYRSGRTFN